MQGKHGVADKMWPFIAKKIYVQFMCFAEESFC